MDGKTKKERKIKNYEKFTMKRYSKFNLYHFLLLCSCFWTLVAYGQERLSEEQDSNKGAVIVVSVDGTAQTKEPEDEGLTSRVIPGSVLSEGKFTRSNDGWTGDPVTIEWYSFDSGARNKMIIGRFDQVPFELGEGEVEDLKEEPSVSECRNRFGNRFIDCEDEKAL